MLYTDNAIKNRIKKQEKIRKISNIIMYIILIPILIYNMSLIIQALINPNKTPDFLGIKTYVIISGSMEPNLNIGDIVVIKEEENLNVGDIISFRQGQSVITHRITEKIENENEVRYKTKGDNNNTEDTGTISSSVIEGKAILQIKKIGKISLFLQDKIVIIFIIAISYIYISFGISVQKRKEIRKIKRMKLESERGTNAKE